MHTNPQLFIINYWTLP